MSTSRHRTTFTEWVRGGVANPLRLLVLAAVLGLASVLIAAPALAKPAQPGLVEGTPCTASAKACVDLGSARAWLIDNGKVIRGPVPMRSGVKGHRTDTGNFNVGWKSKNHVSSETGGKMPYSVFFDMKRGIAFHEGRLSRGSLGCIRLQMDDAIAFFNYLKRGDQVQVR